ncbi:hypothetical protein HD806DRAFT_513621 [Xylariaceae sp. AK1471]|nr:hypothetical protein HD806DRAFT_513621 [Xylariaceae sp. AK1471]
MPNPPQRNLQPVQSPTSAFQDAIARTGRHIRIHGRILTPLNMPGQRGQPRLPEKTRASCRRRNQDRATLAQLGYDTDSDLEFGMVETSELLEDELIDELL